MSLLSLDLFLLCFIYIYHQRLHLSVRHIKYFIEYFDMYYYLFVWDFHNTVGHSWTYLVSKQTEHKVCEKKTTASLLKKINILAWVVVYLIIFAQPVLPEKQPDNIKQCFTCFLKSLVIGLGNRRNDWVCERPKVYYLSQI